MSSGLVRDAPLGLDHDLPDLAVEVEVVDVVAAEVGLEHGEDVGDGHVEAPGLGAVEVEPELGHAGRERREDAGQLGPLAGLVQEPVDDRLPARSTPLPVAVLDHELEAAGLAQAADRRRLEDQRPRRRGPALESCCLELSRPAPARAAPASSARDHSFERHEGRRRSCVWLVALISVQAVEHDDVADPLELPARSRSTRLSDPRGRLAGWCRRASGSPTIR